MADYSREIPTVKPLRVKSQGEVIKDINEGMRIKKASWFVFVEKGDQPKIWPIVNKEVVFGRSNECDFVINNLCVSRRHFKILSFDGVLILNDLNSTNGLRVNGKDVTESVRLNDGDLIEVAMFQGEDGVAIRLMNRNSIESNPVAKALMEHVYQINGMGVVPFPLYMPDLFLSKSDPRDYAAMCGSLIAGVEFFLKFLFSVCFSIMRREDILGLFLHRTNGWDFKKLTMGSWVKLIFICLDIFDKNSKRFLDTSSFRRLMDVCLDFVSARNRLAHSSNMEPLFYFESFNEMKSLKNKMRDLGGFLDGFIMFAPFSMDSFDGGDGLLNCRVFNCYNFEFTIETVKVPINKMHPFNWFCLYDMSSGEISCLAPFFYCALSSKSSVYEVYSCLNGFVLDKNDTIVMVSNRSSDVLRVNCYY